MSNPSPNSQTDALSRMQILVAMGVTAIVLLIISRIWLLVDPVEILPVDWSSQALLTGLGLGLGITAASSALYQLWPNYRRSADYYLEMVIKPLTWWDLIWLGLLPGMSEELLFRGVLLPAVGLTWFGLVVSSLCFGALHFSGSQHWPYMIWAAVVGMALGYVTILTGNLLVPIVAHILTNLMSGIWWKLDDYRAARD